MRYPELQQQCEELNKAMEDSTAAQLREARVQLEWALSQFRKAAHLDMRARMQSTPNVQRKYLAHQVKSNASGWGGGPYADQNIVEALTREIYLAQLIAFDAKAA